MNESKVMLVLTKSSRCYIPIDDPPQVVINKIAEVNLADLMIGNRAFVKQF